MPFVCVCTRAPTASAPPPRRGVACAPRAVPALGAGRAVPRGPYPSACPAPVPCSVWRAWGGGGPVRVPPYLARGCAPPVGRVRGVHVGAFEVQRSPSPDCPPTGRAVGVRHPHAVGAGVWVWGPITAPLACMPCEGCVPGGWRGALPGGVACHRCKRRLVSGAVPPPAARPLWPAAGVRRPVCPGCVRCGLWEPAPAPQRAPLRPALLAVGVVKGRPRGGCLPPLRGASEVRRSPSPDCPPTWRAVGVLYPRAVGTGVWVLGPNTVPFSCTPCGGCVPRGWWGPSLGGGGLPLL